MGDKAQRLARRYLELGKPVIFDANVNYYEARGIEHYQGMLPTQEQELEAVAMTKMATMVIADSEYIAEHCKVCNQHVVWIPDNVEMELVPPLASRKGQRRVRLVWSGDPVKLFELLVIEEPLRRFADHIDLVVVTGSLKAMGRWKGDYQQRMERLLRDLNVDIVMYQGVQHLFDIFSHADAVLSPRFLDNTYNMGHTEWKIALGMACGCRALASPIPSYRTVFKRSLQREVVLSETDDEWHSAFDTLVSEGHRAEERVLSRAVVEKYYSSRVISEQHSACVQELFRDVCR